MKIRGLILSVFLCSSLGWAQDTTDEKGFRAGIFRIEPKIEALAAYDNRVVNDRLNNTSEGDAFSEVSAAALMVNHDALFDLSARGLYGYRYYNEYDRVLSDGFYDVGAAIGSDKNPLKLGFSSYLTKTLDYDATVNPATGYEPGSILTDGTSTRFSSRANVGYERDLTEKISIEPTYDMWYYFQDFESGDDAEWQVHRAGLQLGYAQTPKTIFTLSGYYTLQVNDKEDGYTGSIMLGARGRATEKTRWEARIGASAADYEDSGSDQSFVSYVRGTWQATEKVSAYIQGGNDFRPGYGGGSARMVYRLGYGVNWRLIERWRLHVQLLHDYQEALGGGTPSRGVGEPRHFATGQLFYDLTRSFSLSLNGRYVNDEWPTDKVVVSISAVYAF